MNYTQMVAELRKQLRGANTTRKAEIQAEIERIDALIAADATTADQPYVGTFAKEEPVVTPNNYNPGSHVRKATSQEEGTRNLWSPVAGKTASKEVEVTLRKGASGEFAGADGVKGAAMSVKQFNALSANGKRVIVTAFLIEKGESYPGLEDEWWVATAPFYKVPAAERTSLAAAKEQNRFADLLEMTKAAQKANVDLASLESISRIMVNQAKASSYKVAPQLIKDIEE